MNVYRVAVRIVPRRSGRAQAMQTIDVHAETREDAVLHTRLLAGPDYEIIACNVLNIALISG